MNLVCCPPYIHHASTSRGDWLNRWTMSHADIPVSADPDAENRLICLGGFKLDRHHEEVLRSCCN